jgi:hypothetical protein
MTIQLYTQTQIQEKEQHFYCCSTFHSHSRILNKEHNSYLHMSVKQTLLIFLDINSYLSTGREFTFPGKQKL